MNMSFPSLPTWGVSDKSYVFEYQCYPVYVPLSLTFSSLSVMYLEGLLFLFVNLSWSWLMFLGLALCQENH